MYADERIGRTLSRRDIAWMNVAAKVACTSELSRKHGCVIVKGGRLIAVGVNKNRNIGTNGVQYEDLSTHAEVDALSHANDVKGATAYVVRIDKSNDLCYSRPCHSCYDALIESGVRRIVYSV